jgi:hypothetical protein
VWLSVLPALGIQRAVSWGTQQCIRWNDYFAGELPGLHFEFTKEKLIKRKLDVVFVSGSPRFVKQICSDLEGQRVWATCPARRGKRLGILGETGLRWKHVSHAHVGGVTNGEYWVGSNIGKGNWEPFLDPNFRTLQDVVSSVEDGIPIPNPPANAKG